MSRRETNPHFSRPQRPQHEEDLHQQPPPPTLLAPRQEPSGQLPPLQLLPRQEQHGQFPPHGGAPMRQEDRHYPQQEDHLPLHPRQHGDHHRPLPISEAPQRGQRGQSRGGGGRKKRDQPYPTPTPSKHKVNFQEPSSSPKPLPVGSPGLPPPDHPPERLHEHNERHKQPTPQGRRHRDDIKWPTRKKSNPCTWCGAVFCIIFWLVIIIGGLIVLIVYLVFRPQSPHFDVSAATLNAAYLDFGYLLNADFSILANFTNPNKKVHVDFSSVIIYLYYGSTLIATQYVEPFSAARVQSRFAYIHMVTSQVQLPLGESQRLLKQMESNGVLLQVRGVFRARSKLGSILRYSYNLYGLCNIMVTRPPDGMMLKKKCRTKR